MNIETIVVGQFQVNCSVVWGPARQAIVIDPGEDAEVILDFLAERNLEVAAYLLTHGHVDHVSAVAALHEARPAPVAIHPADGSWAFGDANQMVPFYGPPARPARIERELEDGQTWEDGGLTYRVIETPGHTPGGVCFHFPESNALIVGDTLFAGSVGRTDLPGGNSRVLQESLRRLQKLDDSITVYPGHGPTTTIGHEKRTNFFMRG
jgi:hydroxyacylglutathione hydrolase